MQVTNKIIFTEEFCNPESLYPFTLTRRLPNIRIGILTIKEKWEKQLGLASVFKKENDYKDTEHSADLPQAIPEKGFIFLIQANVLPTPDLVKATRRLKNGEYILVNNSPVIARLSRREILPTNELKLSNAISVNTELKTICHPWHIFQLNDWALRADYTLLTRRRKSQSLSKTNRLIGKRNNLFIEKGARVEHCIINTATGPVYIGKNAEILEGSLIRGPLAIGENAVVKMGTKIYGATTIGPCCVAGGEIKNSVLMGYSNKAHDGYLGDSVVGEWCNLGAGTTNSNLKNNADTVSVWTAGGKLSAGKKCGTLMGDYSRTAINTAINTGSVIGVSANIFATGLTAKHTPSFFWGDGLHQSKYELTKALDAIAAWKALKNEKLTTDEIAILKYIFDNV